MAVDAAVSVFGPFLIPAVLFIGGLVVYALFALATRRDTMTTGGDDPGDRRND